MDINWSVVAGALKDKSDSLMKMAESDEDNAAVMMAASLTLGALSHALKLGLQEPAPQPRPPTLHTAAIARAKGYTGDLCPDCGNATMVRNGTCLKCDTCGSTTGCS